MIGTIDTTTTDWRGDTLAASATLGRTVFVTKTAGSPAITAPPGAFYAGDVGRSITATGIPAGATIAAVNSDTSATLSANATTTGSITSTLGGQVLLFVRDTTDFDEDGGWCSIADDPAVRYLTVDHDANTVTLAAGVGANYEAGDPVAVWDVTVPRGGAKVVEYVASVMTDRGNVPAVIPHALIPLTGVESLDGATARLAEGDDGEWYVAQILGRDAVLEAPLRTSAKGERVEVSFDPDLHTGKIAFYTGMEDGEFTEPGMFYGLTSEYPIGSGEWAQTLSMRPAAPSTYTPGGTDRIAVFTLTNGEDSSIPGGFDSAMGLSAESVNITGGDRGVNIVARSEVITMQGGVQFKTDAGYVGRKLDSIDFGTINDTTVAGGYLVVPHDLGEAPNTVVITSDQDNDRRASVISKDPGSFTIRVRNAVGDPIAAGVAVSFNWIALT